MSDESSDEFEKCFAAVSNTKPAKKEPAKRVTKAAAAKANTKAAKTKTNTIDTMFAKSGKEVKTAKTKANAKHQDPISNHHMSSDDSDQAQQDTEPKKKQSLPDCTKLLDEMLNDDISSILIKKPKDNYY